MIKMRYFGAYAQIKWNASQEEIDLALEDCMRVTKEQIAASPFGEPAEIEYQRHVLPLIDPKVPTRRVAISAFATYNYDG
jgi:hypothetical protein